MYVVFREGTMLLELVTLSRPVDADVHGRIWVSLVLKNKRLVPVEAISLSWGTASFIGSIVYSPVTLLPFMYFCKVDCENGPGLRRSGRLFTIIGGGSSFFCWRPLPLAALGGRPRVAGGCPLPLILR